MLLTVMNKHNLYTTLLGFLWLAVLAVLPSTRAVAQVNIRAGRHAACHGGRLSGNG